MGSRAVEEAEGVVNPLKVTCPHCMALPGKLCIGPSITITPIASAESRRRMGGAAMMTRGPVVDLKRPHGARHAAAKEAEMTRLERSKVVTLLRCGADINNLVRAGYETGHCDGINPCDRIFSFASDAYCQINRIPTAWYWANPRRGLLEAAARVEEGRWP